MGHQPTVAELAGATSVDTGLANAVHAELASFLTARELDCARVDPVVGTAITALTELVLGGGKRLRPTFAWWGWRGAGGDAGDPMADAVLRAVAALELLQAGALIHDDLMDGSTTRRGRPTMHVRFAEQHARQGWLGDADRFGGAIATLLGDHALLWADDMLRDAGLPATALERAVPVWHAMRTELIAGQHLDVLAQASADTAEHTALRVARFKSAAYTVERPLHLGAALAGAGPELIDGYRRFGADLGVAFQLRDDLLGVFGDPRVTGKPAGDDLREGKRTLLIALAMRAATEAGDTAAAATIDGALGAADLTGERLDAVRHTLVRLGAVDAVERRIAELTAAALRALDSAGVAQPAADRLAELAVAATRRTS